MRNATTPSLPMEGTGTTTVTNTLIATSSSSVNKVNEDAKATTQKNTGAIAGGVVAGIEGFILVACGIWLLWKRMQARKQLPSDYIGTAKGNWDDKSKKGHNLSNLVFHGWKANTPQRAPTLRTYDVSTTIPIPLYRQNKYIIRDILVFRVATSY